ncbi:MAG: sigma 54-interacting transcriptional regulator [Nitrospirota bacterium]
MIPPAWATTFLTHQLLHYLDFSSPAAARAIDYRALVSGIDGFEPSDSPETFLRDPHHWLPEPLLRRVLAMAEQMGGSKTVAYEAARHYFGQGRPSQPSLLEVIALAFSDVGGMVGSSHLWAGAYTTYLQMQALIPKRRDHPGGEQQCWLLARLAPGIVPMLSAHHFLRGNYEGFTQLYDWVESAACEPCALQISLEEIAAEFPGASIQRDGDRIRVRDASGAVIAEGRRIAMTEETVELDPSSPPPGAAPIVTVRDGRAAMFGSSAPAVPTGRQAVEIVRGGTLAAGSMRHRFREGERYGAPYSCYRFRWRERPRRADTAAAAQVRRQFSSMLLSALQQTQAVHRRLLSATIDQQQLSAENLSLRRRLEASPAGTMHPTILGQSPAIRELCRMIDLLAETDTTALIMGETGTGKELVAQAIHRQSARSAGPFLAVNCGALAESLLESELFGHERGAFTGAINRRRGKFELAHGGTLFLDEIGEVAPAMQVKLLRVLQEREIQRVGGERPIAVDVRIIAATNQPLDKLAAEGRFRQDLYYRLKVVPVAVAPLRERREDIPLLARHFLREYAARLNRRVSAISPETSAILADYGWPGNIRELRHVIERAVLLAGEQPALTPALLPPELQSTQRAGSAESLAVASADRPLPLGDWARCAQLLRQHGSLDELLTMIEWQIVTEAMAAHGGNKSRAAKALGRSYRWLRKLESRLNPPGRSAPQA